MEEHGLTPAALETQLKNFREGFPFLPVTRAASCGDGIRVLDAAGIEQAAARYDRAKESLRVVKFVPASGAATRMFKDLFEFVREGRRTAVVGELLANRRRFAFWPELRTIIGDDADELRTVENIVAEGLRYGETPEGTGVVPPLWGRGAQSRRRASGRRGAVRRRRGRGEDSLYRLARASDPFRSVAGRKDTGLRIPFRGQVSHLLLRAGPFDRHAGRESRLYAFPTCRRAAALPSCGTRGADREPRKDRCGHSLR